MSVAPEAPPSCASTGHHRDSSDAGWRSPAAWIESVDAGLSLSSIREVEALAEQLSGLTLPESHRRSPEEMEEPQSLMRHIQVRLLSKNHKLLCCAEKLL